MTTAIVKAGFECDIEVIWSIVTSLIDYSWRSDLKKIEVISDTQFVEYTHEGYATTFTITKTEPFKCWCFDLENSNIKGHWRGEFFQKNGKTEIEFIEEVTAKKRLMAPFLKGYLRKQQAQYIEDLQRAVTAR